MKDPIDSAVDLIFEELDNHVPKTTARVRGPVKKKVVEDFDFDSYFDNLVEENFAVPVQQETYVSENKVIEEVVEQEIVEEVVEKPAAIVEDVEFNLFFDTLVSEGFGEKKPEVQVEELKEEVIVEPETPQIPAYQMMDDLTDKLSTYLDRTNNKYKEPDPQDFGVIVENLSRQIQDVRRLVLENTVVSGIGQGGDGQGPGSGEVWFKYLDDVNLKGLQDGDTIVWDAEVGKWRPGKVDPEPAICEPCIDGGPSPTNTVYEQYISGGSYIEQFDDGVTDGGDSRDLCDC